MQYIAHDPFYYECEEVGVESLVCTPRSKGHRSSPNSVSTKETEDNCYLDCSKDFLKPEFKRIVLLRKK